MKQLLANVHLIILLIIVTFSACTQKNNEETPPQENTQNKTKDRNKQITGVLNSANLIHK